MIICVIHVHSRHALHRCAAKLSVSVCGTQIARGIDPHEPRRQWSLMRIYSFVGPNSVSVRLGSRCYWAVRKKPAPNSTRRRFSVAAHEDLHLLPSPLQSVSFKYKEILGDQSTMIVKELLEAAGWGRLLPPTTQLQEAQKPPSLRKLMMIYAFGWHHLAYTFLWQLGIELTMTPEQDLQHLPATGLKTVQSSSYHPVITPVIHDHTQIWHISSDASINPFHPDTPIAWTKAVDLSPNQQRSLCRTIS